MHLYPKKIKEDDHHKPNPKAEFYTKFQRRVRISKAECETLRY